MRFNIAEEKERRSTNAGALRMQRGRRLRGQGEKRGRWI
jgi:hypothetical protein